MTALAGQNLLIRTPEGIAFSLRLASPVARCLANAVDLAVILSICVALDWIGRLLWLVSPDLHRAAGYLAVFAVLVGYWIALEWLWRGQTVGKRLLRLRVVDGQGLRLGLSQIVVRNLLRVVDMMPALYMVGGLSAAISRRCQRLGDLAAGTVVIHERKAAEPDLRGVLAGKYNSFRQQPHLAGRLRQRTSPAEAAVALQAVVRRDRLAPAARTVLFAAVADHFRRVVSFGPEADEGISDEQYVRNVVDILYNRPAPADASGRREACLA